MRWNCPHCGVALSVSEERVTRAWSFSRCYNCSGFSLVRRADIQLLKVKKTQDGRGLILPPECEISEVPRIPSYQLFREPPQDTSVINAPPAVATQIATLTKLQNTKPTILPSARRAIPAPLPEEPQKNWTAKVFKLGAGAMGVIAVASGVFLTYLAVKNTQNLKKSDQITTQSAAPARN